MSVITVYPSLTSSRFALLLFILALLPFLPLGMSAVHETVFYLLVERLLLILLFRMAYICSEISPLFDASFQWFLSIVSHQVKIIYVSVDISVYTVWVRISVDTVWVGISVDTVWVGINVDAVWVGIVVILVWINVDIIGCCFLFVGYRL